MNNSQSFQDIGNYFIGRYPARKGYYLLENGLIYNTATNRYLFPQKSKGNTYFCVVKDVRGKNKKIPLAKYYRLIYKKDIDFSSICPADTRISEDEEFRPIPLFPGYYASNKPYPDGRGRILSQKNRLPIILGSSRNQSGYQLTILYENGVRKPKYTHILLALAYLPFPEGYTLEDFLAGKLEVHHIDGNNQNNSISNLRWVTHDEHLRLHNKKPRVS